MHYLQGNQDHELTENKVNRDIKGATSRLCILKNLA